MYLRNDVGAIDDNGVAARRAQGDVKNRAVLGHVDLVAAEHRVDAIAQPRLFRQLPQKTQGFVRDPVLRVVEIQAGKFSRHALAALRVVCEKGSQVQAADLPVMRLQRLPRWARRQRRLVRHRSLISVRR